ncbi:MAG: hypothetical protein ABIQ08_15235 [Duganella sp.]
MVGAVKPALLELTALTSCAGVPPNNVLANNVAELPLPALSAPLPPPQPARKTVAVSEAQIMFLFIRPLLIGYPSNEGTSLAEMLTNAIPNATEINYVF